ncbi:D-glucuronyl C5-epimerase family protein [Bosea sp. CS1GBMeth4]|uniref:D-glucuronyl C5-epimerase family protein n=1 Tax=Bosea sp. CS1GBMeth4 TaxID=1892849 RepID=UPI0016468AF8|nr:D-glucuronyl C5-epimerase family protein [Bosea sp. CS1GBMeth4]
MRLRLGALAAVLGILSSFAGGAGDREVNAIGPIPIRSVLYSNTRGKPQVLPPTVPYWRGTFWWDEAILAYRDDERIFVNPSNWGLLGLPARDMSRFSSRRTAPGMGCEAGAGLTERQRRIAEHVVVQAHRLPNGALTWLYTQEANANDIILLPPFNSAFSQAVNIHLMAHASCQTRDGRYLETARKAGDALIAPIADGGLMNDADGETWFEEGPNVRGLAPYILNAHIYSINVLFLLAERTGDGKYAEAARRGAASLERLLYKFDTGYWTRYDLRPRYLAMDVEVHVEPDVDVDLIEMRVRDGGDDPQARWSACESGCDATLQAVRAGNTYRFLASLEALRRYSPAPGDELDLNILYRGEQAPRVYAVGVRPGLDEMIAVPPAASPYGRLRVPFGVRDFGWHAPGEEYVLYHAVLLADLYRWRRAPLFFASAVRFANYHRAYEHAKTSTVPRLTTRRFAAGSPDMANPQQDAMIADCFRSLDPLAIDLAIAAARLPACGIDGEKRRAVLARMGFRVEADEGVASDGASTYRLSDLSRIQ